MLFILCSLFPISFAALLGNYRLWDSKGGSFYDYSGNGRHAILDSRDGSGPILTDRGQFIYSKTSIQFPTNSYSSYPGGSTLLVSFWFLAKNDGNLINIYSGTRKSIELGWTRERSGVNGAIYHNHGGYTEADTSLIFDAWNLLTLEFVDSAGSTTMRVIEISTGITLVTQEFTGIPIATIDTTWYLSSSTSNLSMFLYEVWWYDTSFSSVQETLLSYISSKPTEFASVPELDPYKSYNSISCSESCTSLLQSCSSTPTNCLNSCSLDCFSGCYNFSSPRCIFDCPTNCLTCESGTDRCTSCSPAYTYDPSLNTCNCIPGAGIILVSTAPLICTAEVPECESYTAEGCSLCDDNYAIMTGSTSNSCLLDCPEGFYKDTASPATCRECESKCGECSSSTVCSKCIDNTYLLDGACLISCGIGYYENTEDWECEICFENCEKCDYEEGSLVCNKCNSSTFLIEGRCEEDCEEGYYGDINDRECKACSENCQKCETSSVCERCETGYALKYLSGSVGCDFCPIGEYDDGNGQDCVKCPDTCTSCMSGTQCTSCISNAAVSGGTCDCNVGYTYYSRNCSLDFDVSANMNPDGTLTLKFSESLSNELAANSLSFKNGLVTYDSKTFSLSIISSLYSYQISFTKILLTDLNSTKLYFPISPDILTSSSGRNLPQSYLDISITAQSITQYCSSIPNCSTCSLSLDDNFKCDACRGVDCVYSYPSIRCGSCCDDGYFEETIDSKKICTKCDDRCKVCSISTCSECMNDYYLLNSSCLQECPAGYYTNTDDKICEVCPILGCKSCNNSPIHDGIVCSECILGFVLNSETMCSPCVSGTFYNDGICSKCPPLCQHCSSSSECLECIQTASLKSKLCKCNTGLTESSGMCILGFLQVSTEISKEGTLLLSFGIPLLNTLTSSSISVTVNGVTYYSDDLALSEVNSNQYYSISIPGLLIDPNSTVIVNFLDKSSIIGVDGSALPVDEISILAPESNNSTISEPSNSIVSQEDYLAQESIAESLASALATGTQVVFSASAVMSFSSPTGLWSFIKTVQLISVMPFLNVDLPVILFAGFVGLREYVPLPSLTLGVMDQKGPEPFYRAVLMGYETCQFFINSGSIWTGFIITLGLYPFLNLLKRLLRKKHRKTFIYKKVSASIKDYKWNMFMRFLIESYIELAIASGIQTLYISEIDFRDSNLGLNAVIGTMILTLVLIFPIALAIFIYKHRKYVKNKKFLKKWGTVFEEFDTSNEKSVCSFYYVYHLIRIGILLISFCLLKNWPRLQIGLASAACWTVIYNQKMIFDVIIRPFKEKSMNYITIIVEFCVACCYTLVISFTFDMDEYATNIVQWLIIGFASLSCLVNTGYIVYSTLSFIIKKLKSSRCSYIIEIEPEIDHELKNMNENDEIRNMSRSSQFAIQEDNHLFIRRDKIMNYITTQNLSIIN